MRRDNGEEGSREDSSRDARRVYGVLGPNRINDQPACWDEYDSYIGGAFKLLLENGSDGELAAYLRKIVRERMELSPEEGAIGNTIKALRKIRLT